MKVISSNRAQRQRIQFGGGGGTVTALSVRRGLDQAIDLHDCEDYQRCFQKPAKSLRSPVTPSSADRFKLTTGTEKTMTLTGECCCGSIKYQINGKLKNARSCHCSRCRKTFSAQASAYALVDKADFHWLQGQSLLTSFISQGDFGLQFCSRCGSTLCGTYQGDVHGVTLGCLNGDPDIEIDYHIFVDSKATWEVLPEGIRCFPEGANDT